MLGFHDESAQNKNKSKGKVLGIENNFSAYIVVTRLMDADRMVLWVCH